jgi:hypothetical protein
LAVLPTPNWTDGRTLNADESDRLVNTTDTEDPLAALE